MYVCTMRPPLHVNWDVILHFKHLRVLRKNSNKAETKFQFNVYTDVNNRERTRARDKKQRIRISLEEKHGNLRAGAVKK